MSIVKPFGTGVPIALLIAFLACAPAVLVRSTSNSATQFRVQIDAEQVFFSGTMTNWKPLSLTKRGGAFELELRLSPGKYEYRLTACDFKGERQIFPEGVERADDGFGGENSVLRVP